MKFNKILYYLTLEMLIYSLNYNK